MRLSRSPEREFLTAAGLAVGITAAVCLPLAGAVAGGPGVAGAAAGLGLLVGLFGVSALLHLAAASLGPQLWMAVTVVGFAVRLLGYFAGLRALEGVPGLSTMALALTAAAGILIGQALELRALGRARSGAYITPTRAGNRTEGVDQ